MADEVVVLAPAFQTSHYDEVALFNRALTGPEITDIFSAASASFLSNPEESAGWEEVYGTDQPLSPVPEVPVMTNGIVRISQVDTSPMFAVSRFVPSVGYVEQGRLTIWENTSGTTFTRQTAVLDRSVYEWTPERGVIRVVVRGTRRAEVFITLQRGWTGPRVEVYASADSSASPTIAGAQVRWTPRANVPHIVTANTKVALASDEAGWDNAVFSDFVLSGENWVHLSGSFYGVAAAVMRTGAMCRTYSDVTAYGATRAAFALCADQGTPQAGYVSAQFGFTGGTIQSSILGPFEAETYINSGGTRTIQSDAAASGGSAVQDTQTGPAAATVDIPNAITVAKRGVLALYARVRMVAAGTLTLRTTKSGSGSTINTITTTSTTYIWLYLGQFNVDFADNALSLALYSAGQARIDRLVAVLAEARTGTIAGEELDGARDLGAMALYDSRGVPELVTR